MFKLLKNLFTKEEVNQITYKHFVGIVKKDVSGRLRHHIYVDGALAKEEITVENWLPVYDIPLQKHEVLDLIQKRK